MKNYKVFYLTGGYSNFVCRSITGLFSWEEAQKQVLEIRKTGYASMAVKNGHLIGGYSSFSDFETKEEAKQYYDKYVLPTF